MLHTFLSLPITEGAFLLAHLTLSVVVAATITAAALVGRMAALLADDRRPAARHRTPTLAVPISAPPAPSTEEPEAAFDPLDERTSLEEVERFLDALLCENALDGPTGELEPVR